MPEAKQGYMSMTDVIRLCDYNIRSHITHVIAIISMMNHHIVQTFLICTILLFVAIQPVEAQQSLDDQLDQNTFIEGLSELGLNDLLGHILSTQGNNDPALQSLVRIAQLRNTYLKSDSDLIILEQLLAERRQLLRNYSDDIRYASWLGDLAFDLLYLALPESGLDIIVEFGVPTESQRKKYNIWTFEALDISQEAVDNIADTILDIEETAGFADNAKLQQQRRHLIHFEQRERLPYLLEVARYRTAIAEASKTSMYFIHSSDAAYLDSISYVIEGIDIFHDQLDDPWLTEADLLVGLSLARLGSTDDAINILQSVYQNDAMSDQHKMRSILGQVLVRSRHDSSQEALSYITDLPNQEDWIARDPYWMLLLSDQKLRYRYQAVTDGDWAAKDGSSGLTPTDTLTTEAMTWIIAAYDQFLEDDTLPITRNRRESIVGERLATIVPADWPTDQLPAAVVLARSRIVLSKISNDAPEFVIDTEITNALTVLQVLIDQSDTPESIRTDALYLLALSMLKNGDTADAAAAFYDFAQAYPADDRAVIAASQMLVITFDLYQSSNHSTSAAKSLDAALTFVFEQYPTLPGFNVWAYRRGIFEEEHDHLDNAIDAFKLIPEDDSLYPAAQYKIATITLDIASSESAPAGDLERAITRAVSVITILDDINNTLSSSTESTTLNQSIQYVEDLRNRAGSAYLTLEQPQDAIAICEQIDLQQNLSATMQGIAAQRLLIRVRSFYMLEQWDHAESELHSVFINDRMTGSFDHVLQGVLLPIASGVHQDILELEADAMITIGDAGEIENSPVIAEFRLAVSQQFNLVTTLIHNILTQYQMDIDEVTRFQLQFYQAEASRMTGEYHDGLLLYTTLLKTNRSSAAVLSGKAECLFALHKDADAITLYQQLTQGLMAERGAIYWQAELRSLQILDRVNRNTDRIFPKIQRLRHLDPDLGGAQFARAFAVLEIRYAP